MPSSLRVARERHGLTQEELARRAGVTRQLLAAAEAGRHIPSVEAAIRIARALGTTVEQLFAEQPATWVALLGELPPDGSPILAAEVGDRLVVAPLGADLEPAPGWVPADGVMEAGHPQLFADAERLGLVALGCDPALSLVGSLLAARGRRRLVAISATTGRAIEALAEGHCHAALVHGPEDALPQPPVPAVRWHLARWRVGIALVPETRVGLGDLLVRGEPIVQRHPSASSQQALVRAARQQGAPSLPPGPLASGHLDAARRAELTGLPALTFEPAAVFLGLRFLPLETHAVELWVGEQWLDHPGVAGLGELLASRALAQRLAAIGAYDPAGIGERKAA